MKVGDELINRNNKHKHIIIKIIHNKLVTTKSIIDDIETMYYITYIPEFFYTNEELRKMKLKTII